VAVGDHPTWRFPRGPSPRERMRTSRIGSPGIGTAQGPECGSGSRNAIKGRGEVVEGAWVHAVGGDGMMSSLLDSSGGTVPDGVAQRRDRVGRDGPGWVTCTHVNSLGLGARCLT